MIALKLAAFAGGHTCTVFSLRRDNVKLICNNLGCLFTTFDEIISLLFGVKGDCIILNCFANINTARLHVGKY